MIAGMEASVSRSGTPLGKETIVGLLEVVEWFASLNAEELDALAKTATTVHWEPGEVIFEEGDQGDSCYVVYSGSVKVLRRFADGRRVTLAKLQGGSVFGELALFSGGRRSATVQATEPTTAISLSEAHVMSIFRSDPEAALSLAAHLAELLRTTNERLLEHSLASTSGRVVATLLSQVEAKQSRGKAGDTDIELVGRPTDIARLAGAARESVERVMHWLENEGVISLKRGKTIIHDPAALQKLLR
jgi:CRP/FNR family transcriptional regulator